MSETVYFPMEPRGLCDHPESNLIQVQGEPMIFKKVCPICDNYFADHGDDAEKRLESSCNE
jgi:hypothetical protein